MCQLTWPPAGEQESRCNLSQKPLDDTSAAPAPPLPARLGERAPDFTLQDTFGNTYQLSQFAGQSPVVLIFIYGDTCPVCHGQLAQLRDKIKAFRQRGVQILVVDPHEPYRVRHMLKNVGAAADDVAFPILADPA